MKHILLAFVLASLAATGSAQDKGKGEPVSAKTTPNPVVVPNDNCVKKDKNGKCPALPDSPKPTPKKKAD